MRKGTDRLFYAAMRSATPVTPDDFHLPHGRQLFWGPVLSLFYRSSLSSQKSPEYLGTYHRWRLLAETSIAGFDEDERGQIFHDNQEHLYSEFE